MEERKNKKLQEIKEYGDFEFECECCHRKFKTYNSLRSHHGHCKDYHFEHKQSKYKISENLYKCECGREFDNPQSLNAHLSHCKYHHNCLGTEIKKRPHELNHTMAGWDNFSQEYIKKIYDKSTNTIREKFESGELISFWDDKKNDTKQSRLKLSISMSKLREEGKIPCKGIMGYYNGIHCDSSWELAYLVYCIEHDIPIKRCKVRFNYKYNGTTHTYTPDFIINENQLVEIKGFKDRSWVEKEKCCKENNIKIIDENEIKPYIDYVKNKYGKDFISLYEK